jgi:hypothetical protein
MTERQFPDGFPWGAATARVSAWFGSTTPRCVGPPSKAHVGTERSSPATG